MSCRRCACVRVPLQLEKKQEAERLRQEELKRLREAELAAKRANKQYLKKGGGKMANDERLRVDVEKVRRQHVAVRDAMPPCCCAVMP